MFSTALPQIFGRKIVHIIHVAKMDDRADVLFLKLTENSVVKEHIMY